MACTNKVKNDYIVTFISASSLVLSIVSIIYTHIQTKIDKLNIIPSIYIEEQSILGNDGRTAVHKTLSVYNEGGGIKNVKGNVCSIIDIKYKNYKGDLKTLYIQLSDYYLMQSKSSKPTGNIITFFGTENNRKYFDLDFGFMEMNFEKHGVPVNIELKNILTLSYNDRLDEKYKVYFTNNQEDTAENVTPYLSACDIDGTKKHRYSLSNLTPSMIKEIIDNDDN